MIGIAVTLLLAFGAVTFAIGYRVGRAKASSEAETFREMLALRSLHDVPVARGEIDRV